VLGHDYMKVSKCAMLCLCRSAISPVTTRFQHPATITHPAAFATSFTLSESVPDYRFHLQLALQPRTRGGCGCTVNLPAARKAGLPPILSLVRLRPIHSSVRYCDDAPACCPPDLLTPSQAKSKISKAIGSGVRAKHAHQCDPCLRQSPYDTT